MWQRLKMLWQIWTVDRPAELGDWLWDVLVVQFAAWLDRLTVRKVIALIRVVIILLAYGHGIPIPPEFMLVGDVLAYLDIVSILLLVGILSRVSTILFVVKQAIAGVVRLTIVVSGGLRWLNIRHRRARRGTRQVRGRETDDDGCPDICGVAWA
ncbi:MAG: hypothetical protein WA702_04395 [Bradyrhizobium sp.]|jgi:hypothetical protein|uniref:hypothetical protein n=1 Tax=Bradyrhizobium sp. TaxID=376 RepID=UPI003C7E58FB